MQNHCAALPSAARAPAAPGCACWVPRPPRSTRDCAGGLQRHCRQDRQPSEAGSFVCNTDPRAQHAEK